MEEDIGTKALSTPKVQVAANHASFANRLCVAAEDITIGLHQDVGAGVEMSRHQHIECVRVSQLAKANSAREARLGSQRQIAATAAICDGQITLGIHFQGGRGQHITQQRRASLQLNRLLSTGQRLGGKQPF